MHKRDYIHGRYSARADDTEAEHPASSSIDDENDVKKSDSALQATVHMAIQISKKNKVQAEQKQIKNHKPGIATDISGITIYIPTIRDSSELPGMV